MIAAMTATYGIGQIVGPLVAGTLYDRSGSFNPSLSAAALRWCWPPRWLRQEGGERQRSEADPEAGAFSRGRGRVAFAPDKLGDRLANRPQLAGFGQRQGIEHALRQIPAPPEATQASIA
jgi:hypothetical protein